MKERIEAKPAQKPDIPPKPPVVTKTSAPLKVPANKKLPVDEPTTSSAVRSADSLRESMRRKIEPDSAAALPKDPDDTEEEDKFCYTASKH